MSAIEPLALIFTLTRFPSSLDMGGLPLGILVPIHEYDYLLVSVRDDTNDASIPLRGTPRV